MPGASCANFNSSAVYGRTSGCPSRVGRSFHLGDVAVDMADRDDVVPLAGEPKRHRPAETAQPTGNNCDPLLHCCSPIYSQ